MKFSKKSGAGVGVTRRRELAFSGGIKDGELGVGMEMIMRGFLLVWAFFLCTLALVFLEGATA